VEENKAYAIALAGGEGAALWPLARRSRPRELLHCIRGQNLLEQTLTRVAPLFSVEQRWAITTDDHREALLPCLEPLVGRVIVEPDDRGTAASMIHAALLLERYHPNAVLVFLPVNQHIAQPGKFVDFLSHAIDFAAHQARITLLGLPAAYPSGDYGYIAYDAANGDYPAPIAFFHEKPPIGLCQEYVKQELLWHTGIVVAQVGIFLQECQAVAPEIFEGVCHYLYGDADYYGIPPLSFEKAVLEKTQRASVLPADFSWCDVSTLERFITAHASSSGQRRVVCIDASENLVEAEDSLVALVGVDNICVVQNDGVLLVVNRDQIDKVKHVLDVLKQERNNDYL